MMKILKNKSFFIPVLLGILLVIIFFVIPDQTIDQEKTNQTPVKEGGIISRTVDTIQEIVKHEEKPKEYQYIEIIDSCSPYFEGACVNVRASPSKSGKAVAKLRTGVVLKVSDTVEGDGMTWYKITFDEWLRYEDRVSKDWYVAADFTRPFLDQGVKEYQKGITASTTKHILVDRSEQMLYAYDGDKLFMKQSISTGIKATPTPRGVFHVFKKTPSRYMQGPIPGISTHDYDLPGVPWNLYFTEQGAVIHGAYWHDHFGKPWSNGCVNMPLDKAKELYEWADLGTEVLVRD